MDEDKTATADKPVVAPPEKTFHDHIELGREYLVKFKIVFIVLLVYCMLETHSMIQWYYANHASMSMEGAAGFFSIILFLLGNLKWAMEKTID